jgi:hypothetical protein
MKRRKTRRMSEILLVSRWFIAESIECSTAYLSIWLWLPEKRSADGSEQVKKKKQKLEASSDEDDDDDDDEDEDGPKIVDEEFEGIDRTNIIPRSSRRAALASGLARTNASSSSSSVASKSKTRDDDDDDDEEEAEF